MAAHSARLASGACHCCFLLSKTKANIVARAAVCGGAGQEKFDLVGKLHGAQWTVTKRSPINISLQLPCVLWYSRVTW